ncbi:hypothetical protein WG66_010027 [Moniliophthora roreri]|nr:hypothetical protein WG66_010027 [Moniliophthora roreri]
MHPRRLPLLPFGVSTELRLSYGLQTGRYHSQVWLASPCGGKERAIGGLQSPDEVVSFSDLYNAPSNLVWKILMDILPSSSPCFDTLMLLTK